MTKMKINAIIQARMGSTRLPGKILMPIEGVVMLQHIVTRLSSIEEISKVIIATSTNSQDDQVEEFAAINNIMCFRGSETNVLERFYKTSMKYSSDIYIRATGDNPMIDVQLVKRLIEYFMVYRFSYASCKGYPLGSSVEIFTKGALSEAYKNGKENYEFEHVTPYMYQQIDKNLVGYLVSQSDDSGIRMTIDTKEDMKFAEEIYKRLYLNNPLFGIEEIKFVLKKEPDLLLINGSVHQKVLGE